MAEMLHTPHHVVGVESSESGSSSVYEEPLLHTYTQSTRPRAVPARALAGAMLSWFAAVYALCYLVLPTATTLLGLYEGITSSLIPNTFAFVTMAILSTALAVAIRPAVKLTTSTRRDPVISAAVGSLLVWAIGHEMLPILQPLTEMPLIEGVSFLGINVVESGMIGMMLASFARSPVKAFALGAAFQLMMLSFFTGGL